MNTIFNSIKTLGRKREIIRLFEIPEVKDAFKTEIYIGNKWAFPTSLDGLIHTDQRFHNLKKISIDVDEELNSFRTEFKRITQETRDPKEIETKEKLNELSTKVDGFIDQVKQKYDPTLQVSEDISLFNNQATPLVSALSNRKSTVERFISNLRTRPIQFITGSVGTGKTQLSALIYELDWKEKYWINLRQTTSSDFLKKIVSGLSGNIKPLDVSSLLDKKLPPGSLIVFDDLPSLDVSLTTSIEFIELLNLCSQKDIKVLITSNSEIPFQLKSLLTKDSTNFDQIPPLNEDEIEQVMVSYGAPNGLANEIKDNIKLITSGHPLIVAVIGQFLYKKQWKLIDQEIELFTVDYQELSETTYQQIIATVSDVHTRELLYRLNFVTGSFDNTIVQEIAAVEPTIQNSIERLNSLLGIWIQRKGQSKYELSPLVKKLTPNLPTIVSKRINYVLGHQILSKKRLNQFEARRSIAYFIKSGSINNAGFVYTLVLNESMKNPEFYYDWGFDLYWLTEGLPRNMDIDLQLAIRQLQIMVLMKLNKDLSYLREDLDKIITYAERNNINTAAPAFLMSAIYASVNATKALQYYSSGVAQIEDLMKTSGKAKNDFTIREELIWLPVRSINSKEHLFEWLKVFENLNEDIRNKATVAEHALTGSAILIFNLIKLEEEKDLGKQDWRALADLLIEIAQKADQMGLVYLKAQAIKNTIEILAERINNLPEAKKLADESLTKIQLDDINGSFLINDIIGRQLFYHGQDESALPYVTKAISLNPKFLYSEKLDTFLVMSQLTEESSQQNAHSYMISAREYLDLQDSFSEILKIRVIAELAISYALIGDWRKAILTIEEGATLLMTTSVLSNECKVAIIRLGHVVNYWFHVFCLDGNPPTLDGQPYEKPSRGFFFRRYDQAFIDNTWFADRPFTICFTMLQCFEAMGDYDKAKKWAFTALNINEAASSNIFGVIVQRIIPYLVIEDKYDEAMNCALSSIRSLAILPNIENVKSTRLRSIFDKRPTVAQDKIDELILVSGVLSITLRIVTHIVNRSINRSNLINEAIQSFQKQSDYFSDNRSINEVIEIYRIALADKFDPTDIEKRANEFKGSDDVSVKMIGYLLASAQSEPKEALRLQSACIKQLETYISTILGSGKFLLIPFLENFWFTKHKNETNKFTDKDFWVSSSLPYYNKGTISQKPKFLFKILFHHLNMNMPNWMEEWIDG